MAYQVNKTDGTLLVTVADGTLNTSATSLSLPGKNFAGYGEQIAENFVHALEHFSNTTAPTNPIFGQIWFDTSLGDGKVKVYDTTGMWVTISGSFSGAAPPANPQEGDFWWDSVTNRLYVYDASNSEWVLIGPEGGAATISGDTEVFHIIVNSGGTGGQATNTTGVPPTGGTDTDAIGIVSNNVLIQVISNVAVASPTYYRSTKYIDGTNVRYFSFSPTDGQIEKGSNIGLKASSWYYNGQAKGADVADALAGGLLATQFMRNDDGAGADTSRNPTTVSLDLGASGNRWDIMYANTFNGTATAAQYSDLAERYHADEVLEPGTVVKIGGANEVTKADSSDDVFGVVSTNPGYGMNAGAGEDATHPYIALAGRVPVKVHGAVKKGDKLYGSLYPGVAIHNDFKDRIPFARALEDKLDTGDGVIEAVVMAQI